MATYRDRMILYRETYVATIGRSYRFSRDLLFYMFLDVVKFPRPGIGLAF